MNQNLLKCHYEVIPNFISSTDAKKLAEEFKVNDNYFKFKGDVQAPNSASAYNYLPSLELLVNKVSEVSRIAGEQVLPTFSYGRIYREGSELIKHIDRPSSEVTITLHLNGDSPWPICIETPDGEDVCVNLNPGDAMIYLGCIATHWRPKFEGNEYSQFILNYVRSRGCYGGTYFDKLKCDERPDLLKKEYYG